MAIKQADLKIYKAERMTQFEDGGGKITGLELQSNKSNEIFSDVTPIDRVVGKIEYGKVFPAVKSYGEQLTDSEGKPINGADGKPIIVQETLQAAGVIITKNPEDKNVSALMFGTDDYADEIAQIKNRVESYMSKTVRVAGELMGKQLKGSKTIRLVSQPGNTYPQGGQTVCIVQDEGKVSEIEQYLKIEKSTAKLQEVMVQQGNELRPMMLNVIDMKLYYELQYNFDGGEITGNPTADKRAFLREAQVNDATAYKGASHLVDGATIGDLKIKVKSVYGQLAPPSEGQANVVDQQAGTDSSPIIASGSTASLTTNVDMKPNSQFFIGVGVMPGSLKINYSGGVLIDNGGQIMSGESVVGTINYQNGVILFALTSPTFSGQKTITYSVATAPLTISQTQKIDITEGNRSDTYNINLFPIPEPGSVAVDFIALGQRYRLRDRGDGVLESDGAGVGQVDFKTGSVSITLAAMPDIGTVIVFSFGNKADYKNRGKDYQDGTIDADKATAKIVKQLGEGQILRGSIVVKYDEQQAKDDSKGNITGTGLKGKINYITGELELNFDKMPSKGKKIEVEFEQAKDEDREKDSLTGYAVTGDTQTIQLDQKNVRPNSVRIEFNVMATKDDTKYGYDTMTATMVCNDNGAGKLLTSDGKDAGIIDYDTGVVKLKTSQQVTYWVPVYSFRPRGGSNTATWAAYDKRRETLWSAPPSDGSQFIDVTYAVKGTDTTQSVTVIADSYTLNLAPTFQEYIVPGSLAFSFAGRDFIDRDGALYADIDHATGAGSFMGRVNYQSGEVVLLNWNEGGTSKIKVTSMLTTMNYMPVTAMDFIVPTAPIRQGSLMVRATRNDGVRLEATATEGGVIDSQSMQGEVDHKQGIVSVNFGQWVASAGNEDQPWFTPENISGDKVWQPFTVMIETVKYNAVSTTFAPVDPEILGISLVRLPSDGRVPIFRKGDLVVLHETLTQVVPKEVPKEHVIKFGASLISEAWIEDATGKRVDCDNYSVNLKKGELTIVDNDFSGYEQPLTAMGLIEEENNVTDLQINGDVTLRNPVRHRFTKAAMLSGVMYIGNMQARYNKLFAQSNWQTDQWSDIPSGGQPNWRYNDTEYPVVVTNADTVHERWALVFKDTLSFNIFGENLGMVGIGETSSDCAPINPNTGKPYFILKKQGWGSGGQAPGNVLRFNTDSANKGLWFTRSVIPGHVEDERGDQFNFRFRGFKAGEGK